MAKGLVEQESLTNIANAIRSKNGKTVKYTPAEMPEAIMDISGLDGFPIGGIAAYGGTAIPDGWLLCDGSTVSRELYSDLFKAVGTVFGEGDGSTTFNVPDYRDKFVLGAGGEVDLAETGGEKEHILNLSEMPKHHHQCSGAGNTALKNGAYTLMSDVNGQNPRPNFYTGWEGGGQPHNNMPPYVGTYYIIKAKQSAGVIATVVDNLESTSSTDALSANQGKILNDKINNKGVKLLFNGNITTNGTDIKLSENINNFDLICIVSRSDAGSQSLIRLNTTIIPLALYKAGGTNYNIPASTASSIILNIDNDTTLNCQSGLNKYFAIMQVYGIKL